MAANLTKCDNHVYCKNVTQQINIYNFSGHGFLMKIIRHGCGELYMNWKNLSCCNQIGFLCKLNRHQIGLICEIHERAEPTHAHFL